MSVSEDFEARRRARIKRNRARRARMRLMAFLVVILAVIIIIVCSVSKCSKNNKINTIDNSAIESVTQPPAAIASSAVNISQKKASDIPAPEVGKNDLINVIAESGQKQHVYLTFDDGPNNTITPQILDTLRRYNVKATFFMVGSRAEKNPAVAARAAQEGHLVANHSYSHDYSEIYGSASGFRSEIEKCEEVLTRVVPGYANTFRLYRFNGGSFNDDNYGSEKQEYKKDLAEMGYYHIDWNCLVGDAEGAKKDADGLLEYFENSRLRDRTKNLIILMHDAEDKQETANMLGRLIEQLINEGYTFSRLDEIEFTSGSAVSASQTPDDASPTPAITTSPTSAPSYTDKPVSSSTGSSAGSSNSNKNTGGSSSSSGSGSGSSSSSSSNSSSSSGGASSGNSSSSDSSSSANTNSSGSTSSSSTSGSTGASQSSGGASKPSSGVLEQE